MKEKRVRRRRSLSLLALVSAMVTATACNAGPETADGAEGTAADRGADASTSPAEPTTPDVLTPQLSGPPETSTVLAQAEAADLALATSQAFFDTAPVVVVAHATDQGAQARAAAAAVALGMPLVLAEGAPAPAPQASDEAATGSGTSAEPSTDAATAQPTPSEAALVAELDRLGAETVLTFGTVPDVDLGVEVVQAPADDSALATLLDVPSADVEIDDPLQAVVGASPGTLTSVRPATVADPASPAPGDTQAAPGAGDVGDAGPVDPDQELPPTSPADPLADTLVLTTGEPHQLAAVATARAAQAPVVVVPGGDPRASSATVQALAGSDHARTVGLGGAFGDAPTLQWRVATASTGTELPGGGQLVLPGKTYVALYGTPISGSLGVLGEQGPQATIERADQHAGWYASLTDTTVVPALEIIATVASGQAGSDGDYSNEWPIEDLRPLVDLARQNGQYVVLDLQPGRTDFLTQAKQYEELLLEPHVGLALDPEWRLGPDEVHLRQIGQVGVEEVNTVVTWLADLTRDNRLPQKLLVLHQFQVRMIPGSDSVDQSRSELAVLVHVDGQGSQPAKQDTWRLLHRNTPSIRWWGWKNFYDEDRPMLTPEQTMQVEPTPNFISYQ